MDDKLGDSMIITKLKMGAMITTALALTGGVFGYGQHYVKTNVNTESVKEIKVVVKKNEKDIVRVSTIQERTVKVLDELEKRVYKK